MAGPYELWRHVALDAQRMEARAPEGHVVAVIVYITGRDRVEAGHVVWNKDFDYPYLRIEVEGARGVEDKLHPSTRQIYVHRDRIERVELAFKDKPEEYDFERFQVTNFESPHDPVHGDDPNGDQAS